MARYSLDRNNTLLLVIDVQERLLPAMAQQEPLLKNIEVLIKTAQTLELPILVTEQYPKGLGPTVSRLMEVLGEAPVIEKMTFSACTTELLEAIGRTGRKQIIVTGMETHVCVFQTVRDLLANGFEVFLPRDGVMSRALENYQNALDMMKELGAVISNTETLFFDLLKVAGTPEFKALSPLIK